MSDLSAEWRRIPLSQCRDCPKLTPSESIVCKRCEKVASHDV